MVILQIDAAGLFLGLLFRLENRSLFLGEFKVIWIGLKLNNVVSKFDDYIENFFMVENWFNEDLKDLIKSVVLLFIVGS